MNLAVFVGSKLPGKISRLVNKAFGNNCYAHEMSVYPGIEYQKVGLGEINFIEQKEMQEESSDLKGRSNRKREGDYKQRNEKPEKSIFL